MVLSRLSKGVVEEVEGDSLGCRPRGLRDLSSRIVQRFPSHSDCRGAGGWALDPNDFPEVIVEEALKMVAELKSL